MNRDQALRGPDGGGTQVLAQGRVSLAHTRLAVLDLSEAAGQPMAGPGQRHWLVFNGEIYNHRELRRELEGAGETFVSTSDTEVLLRMLMRHGAGALDRLEGMFAFVHVDLERGVMLAARDRLGIKPLYFYQGGGLFGFSSTLAPLRRLPGFTGAIDPMARFEMLVSKYVAAPRSIYQQIGKVPPGSFVRLNLDGQGPVPEPQAWWTIGQWLDPQAAPVAPDASEDVWEEALAQAVERSVSRQLVADVPVGVLLSGGIDSSLVAATAMRLAGGVDTFCVGYAEGAYDESRHARAVAAHIGSRHHELLVSPQQVLQALTSIAEAYDEPFGDASAVPTYLLSRFARERVTVVLSGDGGDEQFFGYTRHHLLARALPWLRLVPGPARRLAATLTSRAPRGRLAHALSAFFAFPDESRLYTHHVLDNFAAQAELCGAGPRAMLWDSGLHTRSVEGASLARGDFLKAMLLADLGGYMVDDCLTKVDRASMACSLEARVPLLDELILRLSLPMPVGLSWRGGMGKHLLRRVLARSVPRALFERPKMGFGLPLDGWLFGPLRDFTEEVLSRNNLLVAGLDPDGVQRIMAAHKAGRADHQYFLWPLICYVRWYLAQAAS